MDFNRSGFSRVDFMRLSSARRDSYVAGFSFNWVFIRLAFQTAVFFFIWVFIRLTFLHCWVLIRPNFARLDFYTAELFIGFGFLKTGF